MARCFVIGPIGDKFAPLGSPGRDRYEEAIEVFEKVILPACNELSLEAIRADQIAISGEITEQVFRHLYEDEVVVADVSGGNPNVMYELGLRHTRDLLTVQLGEYGQLPFDITAVRTIRFSRSERGLIDARKHLMAALSAGLAEGADQVTATRIWNRATANEANEHFRVELTEESVGFNTDVEDLDADGFLERMVTVEETFPVLTDTAEKIAALMGRLGEEAEEITRDMNLVESSAPASARVGIVARFAEMLKSYADEFDKATNDFTTNMDNIDGGVNGILEYMSVNPESVTTLDAGEFLDSIAGLARTSRASMEELGQFRVILKGLGGMSKLLRQPSNRMSDSLARIAQATRLMDEWEAAVIRLRRGQERRAKQTLEEERAPSSDLP